MRKLLTFFFALAVTVGVSVSAFGQVGQIPTHSPVQVSAPVGPPTFVFQTVVSFSGTGGNNFTSGSVALTGAPASSLICAQFWLLSSANVTSATINGVAATSTFIGISSVPHDHFVVCAVVTGSPATATVNIALDGGSFGSDGGIWTADSTQLVSTVPTTGFVQSTSSPATATVNVSSGGAVIAVLDPFSVTSTGYTTPNDPGVVGNGSFPLFGTANNAAANSSSRVSGGFTGSGGSMTVAVAAFP
jgi:hypothetical protein